MMTAGIITVLVEVPRWTEAEIIAVDAADRVATWREVDRTAKPGTTEVSFDVEASSEFEAHRLVPVALDDLPPGAFKASTA